MTETMTAERPPAPTPATTPTVFEAIVRKMCLSATYNKVEMTLAPHVIYTRHDELFVDAEVVARDGKPPREPKIGTFKLIGNLSTLLAGCDQRLLCSSAVITLSSSFHQRTAS